MRVRLCMCACMWVCACLRVCGYTHPLPNPPPHFGGGGGGIGLMVAVLGVRAAPYSVPDPRAALWLAALALGCRCLASLAGVVEVELVLLPRFLSDVWVYVVFDVVAIAVIVDIELRHVLRLLRLVVFENRFDFLPCDSVCDCKFFDSLAQIYFFHVTFCFLSVMLSQEGLPLNIGFPVLPQTQVFILS